MTEAQQAEAAAAGAAPLQQLEKAAAEQMAEVPGRGGREAV